MLYGKRIYEREEKNVPLGTVDRTADDGVTMVLYAFYYLVR